MSRQQMTAEQLAQMLFFKIRTDLPSNTGIAKAKRDRVENEIVYLSIFLIELGVYLEYKESPERHLVMDIFWNRVSESGLSGEALTNRLESYTKAVKTKSQDEAWMKLGQTFAWCCLAQEDTSIALVGEETSRQVTQEIAEILKSSQISL